MSELRNRTGAQIIAAELEAKQNNVVAERDPDLYTVTSAGRGECVDIRAAQQKNKPVLYMGGAANFKGEEMEDIIRSSVLPRHKVPFKSISNVAKEVKDKLEDDPYNIEHIRDLGYLYCAEFQWDKAANVMMRGWKRASELKTADERFEFLMKLAEVSFRDFHFKQAHAIMMDVDEPEDYNEKKAYQLLSCHIFAENGDAPKSLAIFSKAIEGEEFESAIKIWAACALRLKKVGAYEAAKNAVMNKARSGQNYHMDQSRIQCVESWAIMSNDGEKKATPWYQIDLDAIQRDGPPTWMKGSAVGFVVFLFTMWLWWLESRSLQSLKLT